MYKCIHQAWSTFLTGLMIASLFTLLAIPGAGGNEDFLEQPEGWELQKGDWIVANVQNNTLQFVRADNSEYSSKILIGSGINDGRMMSYLGRYYNPITPQQEWEIRSKNQQGWWEVFGSREAREQLFLRLYEVRGEERVRTHYGFHTTPNIDVIIANGGFGSWGCILTRYDLLKMIEELYHLNGEVVRVVTTNHNADAL